MRILYLASSGTSDPTRASIPLHLAVNGSIEIGHVVEVVLAGDATEFLQPDALERVEGVGLPPVRDLFSKAQEHRIPIYVWKGCAVARGATEDQLVGIGGQWVTPPDVARLIEKADRVVTFWRRTRWGQPATPVADVWASANSSPRRPAHDSVPLYGRAPLPGPWRYSGTASVTRQQTRAVELTVRREDDLDACEHLAPVVHAADGYPPRCADDLRVFVSAADALGAWVAETDQGIVGHVALMQRSSRVVMGVGSAVTGRPPEQLCVVARLFVAPTERNAGIGSSLLACAANAGLARGLRPILDVAAHLDNAIRLYERARWMCAGQVTVDFAKEAPLEELVYIGPDSESVGR